MAFLSWVAAGPKADTRTTARRVLVATNLEAAQAEAVGYLHPDEQPGSVWWPEKAARRWRLPILDSRRGSWVVVEDEQE